MMATVSCIVAFHSVWDGPAAIVTIIDWSLMLRDPIHLVCRGPE
jgi:hypothetical protein